MWNTTPTLSLLSSSSGQNSDVEIRCFMLKSFLSYTMKLKKIALFLVPLRLTCITFYFSLLAMSVTAENYHDLWDFLHGIDHNRLLHAYNQCPIVDQGRRALSSKAYVKSSKKSKSSKSSKKSSNSSKKSKSSKFPNPYTIEYTFRTETNLIGNLDRVMNSHERRKFECVVGKYLEESWDNLCSQSDSQVITWVVENQILDLDVDKEDFGILAQFSYPTSSKGGSRKLQASPRVVTDNRGSGTYRAPPPLDGSKIITESVVSTPSRRRLDSKKSSKNSMSYKSSKSKKQSSGKKSSKTVTSGDSDELLQRLRATDSYFDDVVTIVTRVTTYEERARSSLQDNKDLDLSVCRGLM